MDSLEALAEYLVIKVLAGRRSVVEAIYEYFVLDVSPKLIADRYSMTVGQVRGYINRVLEKTMSFHRARVLLKHIYPYVAGLKPIVISGICTICGASIPYEVELHIMMLHRDIVDMYVEEIAESILYSVLRPRAKIEVVA